MGRVYLQKSDFSSALASFAALQARAPRDPSVWALGGHIHYMQRNIDDGISCYETALSYIEEPSMLHNPVISFTLGTPSITLFSELAVLLRLGDLFLDKRNYSSAKTVFLKACARYSSAAAWLGTGVALYQLGQFPDAEEALAEANIQNNQLPDSWGYLALLCLRTHRTREATQAFKLALRLHLSNPVLLCDIGECYLKTGNREIAEECLRAAMSHYEDQYQKRKPQAQPTDRWVGTDPKLVYDRAGKLLESIHKTVL